MILKSETHFGTWKVSGQFQGIPVALLLVVGLGQAIPEDERACFFLFTLCIPCGLFSITVPYTCISLLAIWQCFSKNWISQPYVLTDSPKVTEWQKRCCMAHGPELRTWAGLEKERKQLIEKCRDSEVMRTGVGLNPRHLPTQTNRHG